MPEVLVALEGIDNAGKSSLLRALTPLLVHAGVDVHLFINRAPEEEVLRRIQQAIEELRAGNDTHNARTHALLASAFYSHALWQLERKSFTNRSVIIFDRYIYSTVVYSSLLGVTQEWLENLLDPLRPADLVILIDIDPTHAWEREVPAPPLESMRMARERFRDLLVDRRWHFSRMVVVDGGDALEELSAAVAGHILELVTP